MGERKEVSILSHRPVTSSDLKQERLFFRESVSTFWQLVVASNWSFSLTQHFERDCSWVPEGGMAVNKHFPSFYFSQYRPRKCVLQY